MRALGFVPQGEDRGREAKAREVTTSRVRAPVTNVACLRNVGAWVTRKQGTIQHLASFLTRRPTSSATSSNEEQQAPAPAPAPSGSDTGGGQSQAAQGKEGGGEGGGGGGEDKGKPQQRFGMNGGPQSSAEERGEIPGVGPTRHIYTGQDGKRMEIREVWLENLDKEMVAVREVVEQYPYVAMDTEFPGVVARPVGDVSASDYQYKTLKCNVDLLKIIQLGLSFADSDGNSPPDCPTWQFNFRFSLSDDIYAEDSIELLKQSGIDFSKHESHGIDVFRFGELLMTSGLVLMDEVRWISFHSGYDFGYLLKVLTCAALPSDENGFFDLLRTYFPCFYDIKYLMTACQGLHGGLQRIAEELSVARVGPMHQAGSDSLLTAQTFFRLCAVSFDGLNNLSDEKFKGELFGLGHNHTVYRSKMQNTNRHGHGGLERQREVPPPTDRSDSVSSLQSVSSISGPRRVGTEAAATSPSAGTGTGGNVDANVMSD
ncbi:hypothetical protein NSK_003737 [Nannochloropsis salina CCMP1776]|uniref:poly(A)-specific ribonuclease n=1 Tax=Nannochloropsis salina CCMP1776 TaxID=1027361 RepID=A0A4D9D2V6_9STRA|nr:hypothetical protein NSK_003737 [Nannochloropsis salina CCMP1776]|eukprot:TFJ85314.1 hypothetical protein NSK_003737 [Nannochloropsis salina CCMP1776]